MSDFLPEVQLSAFVQSLQVQFEYMHPIVSRNKVSNRNQKNGALSYKKGKFRFSELSLSFGVQFLYLKDIRRLVFAFHRSTCDLLSEGIRLQYRYFFEA